MSDPRSRSHIALQWVLEGLTVAVIFYLIIMWAFPELREARRPVAILIGATFLVYEFGRWLADKFVGDDDD